MTIISDDLERTITDMSYASPIIGTVTAPALSDQPLTVTHGEFNYFIEDTDGPKSLGLLSRLLRFLGFSQNTAAVETKRMQYKMQLTSGDGKHYYLYGFKIIRNHPGPDCWPDATTLYITLHEGESTQGKVIGKGILNIPLASLMRQLTTMQVTNASGLAQRWDAMLRFGRFFGGQLIDTYGAHLV